MKSYRVTDQLSLWWLAVPDQPRLVGMLRLVRRSVLQSSGVSLQYAPTWLGAGHALSEDLPLRNGEFLPMENDCAAGAVDDARPDRWGEWVIRLLDRPTRLSTLEYLYFAGDERFGALGVSTSSSVYAPHRHGPLPALGDVQAMFDLVRQVEAGQPVDERLRRLVSPGATLGGARPKALLEIDRVQWVVKFAEAGDPLDSPLIEHATMTLPRATRATDRPSVSARTASGFDDIKALPAEIESGLVAHMSCAYNPHIQTVKSATCSSSTEPPRRPPTSRSTPKCWRWHARWE